MTQMKTCYSSLIAVLVLLSAPAALAGLTYLPSAGEEGCIYSGASNIQGPTIEFAVFDSESGNYNGIDGIQFEETGKYVYVYQIFNDYFSEISHFNVYGIGEGAVDSGDDITTVDDGIGVDADSEYFNADFSKGTWSFAAGTLIGGKDSVFLVICSDNSWTAGSYDFSKSDDTPVPSGENEPPIPEPATLLLLTLGAGYLIRKP